MTDPGLVLVANAVDGSITTFRFDGGRLERLTVTAELSGCSTFAIDPSRDLVYAAVKGEPAGIVTLRLDRASGRLEQVFRRDLPEGGMTYLALTRAGSALLGASYGGGCGCSWPVADGVVGAPVSRIAYPNLHSVQPTADGRFVYFASLGADLVAQYALTDDLVLTPLDPETVAAPEGSGPRHLVINAAQDAAYVMTEFSAEVLHYARDTESGTLVLRDGANAFDPGAGLSHSRLGADPRAEHLRWGADLHLDDAAGRIWTSERTAGTLAAVAVAPDGSVTEPKAFIPTEAQPRGFALSADGGHLIAAGERSTAVSLYAVEGDDLRLLQRAETGAGANWVRFV